MGTPAALATLSPPPCPPKDRHMEPSAFRGCVLTPTPASVTFPASSNAHRINAGFAVYDKTQRRFAEGLAHRVLLAMVVDHDTAPVRFPDKRCARHIITGIYSQPSSHWPFSSSSFFLRSRDAAQNAVDKLLAFCSLYFWPIPPPH